MTSVVVGSVWLAVGLAAAWALRRGARSAALSRVQVLAVGSPAGPGAVVPRPAGVMATVPEVLGALVSRGSRGRATREELIVVVDELSASLASGASPTQAMTAASRLPGPLASGLALGVHKVNAGSEVQEAIDEWAQRHRDVGATLVADALALASATGGSRTRALAGVRATLREADGLAAEIRALSAQSRLSATVLTLVPVGFAAVVAVADSRIASFLLATPAGWACLVGGGTLDAIGALWMRRLTGPLR